MSEAGFFVRTRGIISGPFGVESLRRMVRAGTLSRIHEVSADRSNWVRASEYEELFPAPTIRGSARELPAVDQSVVLAGESDLPPAPPIADAMPAAADRFYYSQNGATVGPVSLSVLTILTQNGTILSEDMVWREDASSATPARQVPALAAMFSTPAPPAWTLPAPTQTSYRPKGESYSGMATASLVLSILGLFLFGFITGLLAVIFAGVALNGMGRTRNKEGHGAAVTGMVLGIIDIVGWAIWMAVYMDAIERWSHF